MRFLAFFLLFAPLFGMDYESPRPNTPLHTSSCSTFPKVNPMTGEYIEDSCDLVVAGSHPLAFRRFYNHFSAPSCVYGCWRVNPESWIKANFEKIGIPQNVAIGQIEGGCILLDGPGASSYSFNPQSQSSYTNMGEDLPSAHTNPRNVRLTYKKNKDPENPNRFQFVGEIIDGTGKKTAFWTHMHKWHKSKRLKDRTYNPKRWTPYYCSISKEDLPNGNYIEYGYSRYFDDTVHPTHYRIGSIVVYNKKKEQIGGLYFDYPSYDDDQTHHINVTGSDGRKASCQLDYLCLATSTYEIEGIDGKKVIFEGDEKGLIYISQAVSTSAPPVSYSYNDRLRIDQVIHPEGRIFKTAYYPDGKVQAQYIPIGPDDALAPIATYSYHGNTTHLRDGENNLTCFHFDHSKIASIERFHSNDTLFSTERFVWDEQGQLTSKRVEDSQGAALLSTTYFYDEKGNVLEETLTDGKESYTIYRTYSGNKFNLLCSETDRFGAKTEYEYIPDTNLLQAEFVYDNDVLKKRTFHTYDDSAICIKTIVDDGSSKDPDNLIGVTYRLIKNIKPRYKPICYGLPETIEEKTIDSSGQEILLSKIHYEYEPSGQIKSEQHFDANGQHRYTIQNTYQNELLLSKTDAIGYKTNFSYDANHNCVSQNNSRSTITWTYDKANRPVAENNAGLSTQFQYDTLGHVKAKIDPSGNQTHYTYNSLGHVTQITHPDGAIEQKEYDALGRVLKEIDPKGYETRYSYHLRGKPSQIDYPDGTHEQFTYHPNGSLLDHTHRNGVKTVYTYDAFQRPIKEETYGPSGELLKTSSSTYNSFHKLSETDPEGITTYYAYDFAGRKTSEKTLEKEIVFSYDALGRLCRTQQGETVQYEEHDLLDRLVEKRTEDLLGNILFKENYKYDEAGNLTHTITCQGTAETIYNAQNLPIKHISPEGHITQIHYDYKCQFTKTTIDPLGVVKEESHDPCGRLQEMKVKNPEGLLIQHRRFEYDKAGNQIIATEWVYEGFGVSRTQTNAWEYGPQNRLERLVESGIKETRYLYDTYGRLQTLVKPDQTEIDHAYDALGRLSRLASSRKDIDYRYTYDNNDQLLHVFDAVNKTTTLRQYDSYGNLIQEELGNGCILKSVYDPYGKRAALVYPDKSQAGFVYQANYLTQINYNGLTYKYQRNLAGKPTEMSFPKGKIRLDYDQNLRLKKIQTPSFWACAYTYDPRGSLLSYRFGDSLGEIEENYAYDSLNQLISENEHTYCYDSYYNRLSKDDQSYSLNALSQVTSNGETTFEYDSNGNLIKTGDAELLYDSLDRLIEVRKGGQKYQYTYDSFGRRLTKKTPQETIRYIWDGKNEIGSSKGELRVLGEGLGAEIGAAIFIKIGKEVFIPIHDHRGAVVVLLNNEGKAQETIRYTAFGEETEGVGFCPWRFASKRLDLETGYIYFGRRYYSPDLGRWITTDPRGFADGPNLYAYVHNCPLIAIDLYGEWALWQNIKAATKRSFEFAFPCANALFNLSPDASLWQRGMLAGGAVLEIASLALGPARGLVPLAERGVYQLGKMAANKIAQKTLMQQSERITAAALEKKIVGNGIARGGTKALTKSNFRQNLIERTGFDPGKSAQAHHVFPQVFKDKFSSQGINIHNPQFGTWWETASHLKNARNYNSQWLEFFKTNPDKSEILNFGRDLMMKYKMSTGF